MSKLPLFFPLLAPMFFALPLVAGNGEEPQVATPAPAAAANAGNPLYAPVATSATPETFHERLMTWVVRASGPRALLFPAFPAAIRMANPPSTYPHEWRTGMGGFGRNYGDILAAQAARETGRFVASAILHEDYRYRPSGSRNVIVRSFHAFAFTFVDRTDSGRRTLAVANLAGAGASGFVGELYLPKGYNNLSHAETRMAISFGTFAASNLLREFAPEIDRITRRFRIRSSVPEWWVRR